MERAKGIEPSYAAWEAAVLPLNYARKCMFFDFWLRFGSAIMIHAFADCNATEFRTKRADEMYTKRRHFQL